MLAYTNNPSFWDVVWWIFIVSFWVMWILVVINVFIDNFRRRDHSGLAKAMWTILIVFLPILGVIFYMIARPSEPIPEAL
jgi:Phospholipase_D-nuclease N-terminal